MFHQLVVLIRDTGLAQRNRLIFSFVSGIDNQQSTAFMAKLTKTLRCLTLRIPSLRERTDDIPYLCTLYINRLNSSLGKQIISFDPKALKAMKTFLWESNLDQFQRVIHELMVITSDIYISYENTMLQLHKENALWTASGETGLQFNLD